MEYLQWLLRVGLVGLPGVALGLAVRLPPIYRLTQRSQGARAGVILGGAALCLVLTMGLLLWLTSDMIYGIAQYYFDTTLGLVAGMTRAGAAEARLAVINELWLRYSPARWLGQPCFSPASTVCRLADAAVTIGSPDDLVGLAFVVALVPLMLNVWLSWRLSRARTHYEGE
jgi:hypothetical protein